MKEETPAVEAAAEEQASNVLMEHHSLMEIFEELTFRQKIDKVFYGLKQPKDSGDYKWAMFQLQRMWAPFAAVVLPGFLILLIVIFSGRMNAEKTYEVTMMESKEIEELEEIKEIEEEIIPDSEPVEVPVDVITVGGGGQEAGPPSPVAGDFSPQPAQFDTVAITKSPVMLAGIYSSRSPGQRGSALARGGGSGMTEAAVMRALRWLKKNQEGDGSWKAGSGGGPVDHGGVPPAMTGLALLTYLAHGETPSSEEFGQTVEYAMRWLVEKQGANGGWPGSDGHEYSLPIAAYALCEAYSMTKVPMLKEAAEKSIQRIVNGQQARGLWDYNVKKSDRNDLSYGGWCIQAIKAAKIAELNVSGLDASLRNAVNGIKANYGNGGFGYSGPGKTETMSSVGVLCMQILGAGKDRTVTESLEGVLSTATCNWQNPWGGRNAVYAWYYCTQAKFHAGGGTWDAWNKQFAGALVKSQNVIPKAIANTKGEMVDIGYWQTTGDENAKSYVYTTTLCTLQLEVYYRLLPTFKPPADIAQEVGFADKNEDIKIRVNQ